LAIPSLSLAEGFYATGKLESSPPTFDRGEFFEPGADAASDIWAAGVGFRFSEHLALQLEYHDFGIGAGEVNLPPCGPPGSFCLSLPNESVEVETAASCSLTSKRTRAVRFLASACGFS